MSIGSIIVNSKSSNNSLPTFTNSTSGGIDDTSTGGGKSFQNEGEKEHDVPAAARPAVPTTTLKTSMSLIFKHSIKLYNFLIRKMPNESEDLLEFYLNNIVDSTIDIKSENW